MPTGTRCRAVVSLCLLSLLLGAGVSAARTLPHGAVHLRRADYSAVRHGVQCGRIAGHWTPGTRLRAYWFISDARAARDELAAAHRSSGAARRHALVHARMLRRRAAARQTACGPLRFRLRGAAGLALRSASRYRGRDLSNLDVIGRRGQVRDAVVSGSANVAKTFTAPSGKVYVLFRYPQRIDAGQDSGSCDGSADDGTTDDGSADDGSTDSSSADDGTTDDGSGDARAVDDPSSDGCDDGSATAVYCLLAEVDPASSTPTCVDTDLSYLRNTTVPGLNDPVQFDAQGAIYYMGSSRNGSTIVRRSAGGTVTDYLTSRDLLVDDFLALGDGDVLITGATVPTGARWIRRVGPDGHVHNVRSFSADWMRMFPDGSAYLGMWAAGEHGVRRFSPADNTIDPAYWLADRSVDAKFDVEDVCAGADAAAMSAFCEPRGTLATDLVTTTTGKVYAIAGTPSDALIVELYPEVRLVPSTVHKVAAAEPIGDDIALAGVDDQDREVLVLHSTADDSERTLIGPDAETEAFHLAYDAKDGQLLFDGLRFADDKYVLGKVDMATGAVTVDDSGSTAWTGIEASG